MRHIISLIISIFLCAGLSGCTKSDSKIVIEEPVIIGTGTFDNYVLVLEMKEGTYKSVLDPGPTFGANWTGEYELNILDKQNNKTVSSYRLKEWNEPLNFKDFFALNITDYNKDGVFEVLIGQYGGNNYNIYQMYYITEALEIGHYAELGELEITSREMSPRLEVHGGNIIYSLYDNSKGKWVDNKIDMQNIKIN